MTKGWIFHHNWAVRVSKCVVLCKNPKTKKQKYTIEFYFIGGQTYTVEFTDKKARDNHFRFVIRMMEQSYASPYLSYFHWTLHAIFTGIIIYLSALV